MKRGQRIYMPHVVPFFTDEEDEILYQIPEAPPASLKRYAKGRQVRKLQNLLGIYIDGDFGGETERAVIAWQKKHGHDATGIVDDATLEEIALTADPARMRTIVYFRGDIENHKSSTFKTGTLFINDSVYPVESYLLTSDKRWIPYTRSVSGAITYPAPTNTGSKPTGTPAKANSGTQQKKPAKTAPAKTNSGTKTPVKSQATTQQKKPATTTQQKKPTTTVPQLKPFELKPTTAVRDKTRVAHSTPLSIGGAGVAKAAQSSSSIAGKKIQATQPTTPKSTTVTTNTQAKPTRSPRSGKIITGITLQVGSSGHEVETLQEFLKLRVDGGFGDGTKKAVAAWQKKNGLPATGIVDEATLQKMKLPEIEIIKNVTFKKGKKGMEVHMVQRFLKKQGLLGTMKKLTATYDDKTIAAVKTWQQQQGLPETGIVDAATLEKMNLRRPNFDDSYRDYVVQGSTVPNASYDYNVSVKLNATIKNEYMPALEKAFPGMNKGFKLLMIAMTHQEGFYPGSLSYKTNNPGNVGNTDTGSKPIASLTEGIKYQKKHLEEIASGVKSAYKLNTKRKLDAYYSPEIADNQKNYQKSPFLPGYDFGTYTGRLDQFVKIYSTGARTGNAYVNTIISYFKANGLNITPETTLQEIINMK